MKTAPYNVHMGWTATIAFMPDANDKRVLDAGCGVSRYTEWLVEQDAEVVGVDASREMVERAKKRIGDDAKVFHADLERPLDFAEDGSFDMVVSFLALHYVEHWERLFSEFYRVLSPSDSIVFTVHHPFDKFEQREMTEYAETERLSMIWTASSGKEVEMPFYRRPLSAVLNPLADAGFTLKQNHGANADGGVQRAETG